MDSAVRCSWPWRSRIFSPGNSRSWAALAAALALAGLLAPAEAAPEAITADSTASPPAAAAPPAAAPADTVPLLGEVPQSGGSTGRAPADSTRHRASPFWVMMRSAVIPGWGQVYNGKLPKAALVVGGEGLLIYKAIEEYNKENDAAAIGDAVGANRHMNLKVNYLWWAAVVHLLQMADAYVDAQLSHFEADFEPDEAALPGEPSRGLAARLAFRAHF